MSIVTGVIVIAIFAVPLVVMIWYLRQPAVRAAIGAPIA
jgi:hypothetical protein